MTDKDACDANDTHNAASSAALDLRSESEVNSE